MNEEIYGKKVKSQKTLNNTKETPDQEMMIVTTIKELHITGLISDNSMKSEDIDLKEVDNYMDIFLMESTEARIEDSYQRKTLRN